jgi:predicted DNA-binding protein (UPF0251 family)
MSIAGTGTTDHMTKKINADVSDDIVRLALDDYKNRVLTTEEIAQTRGVSAATLTVWAKKAGIRLRSRGRRKLTSPPPTHLRILELSQHLRYDQIGSQMGMQKQAVHRIVKRWKGWKKPKTAPFSPGDLLLWKGKKLTVIDANVAEGTLEDTKGKIYKRFTWGGGITPKKIGVNKKYLKQRAAA